MLSRGRHYEGGLLDSGLLDYQFVGVHSILLWALCRRGWELLVMLSKGHHSEGGLLGCGLVGAQNILLWDLCKGCWRLLRTGGWRLLRTLVGLWRLSTVDQPVGCAGQDVVDLIWTY